jgi:probable rRNA maturation factor
MAITFSYADKQAAIKNKRILREFIAGIFMAEDIPMKDVTYVFCSDEYLLNINRQFLKHDYYTDIITFDLRDGNEDPVLGEIYISSERVAENSRSLKNLMSEELLRVMFHGALHLCGYKDKTKSEIAEMRDREEHYLRLYHSQTTRRST